MKMDGVSMKLIVNNFADYFAKFILVIILLKSINLNPTMLHEEGLPWFAADRNLYI
jgi:hypothetical protein